MKAALNAAFESSFLTCLLVVHVFLVVVSSDSAYHLRVLHFFCILGRGSYESEHTTHSKGGMRQKGREWEGQNSGEQTH